MMLVDVQTMIYVFHLGPSDKNKDGIEWKEFCKHLVETKRNDGFKNNFRFGFGFDVSSFECFFKKENEKQRIGI